MDSNDRSQNRLNSWLQNVLVVVAIGVLIATMLNKGLSGDSWGWQRAEREVLVKRFNENLMLAKTEWLRRGRPGSVDLTTSDNRFVIKMNANGWPATDNGCLQLWQMLAGGRYQPETTVQPHRCNYRLSMDDSEEPLQLSYFSHSGQLK